MKYRVFGHTTVTVTIEVSADNKKDALEVAFDQLTNLTAFAGNGGFDKLVGVYGDAQMIQKTRMTKIETETEESL